MLLKEEENWIKRGHFKMEPKLNYAGGEYDNLPIAFINEKNKNENVYNDVFEEAERLNAHNILHKCPVITFMMGPSGSGKSTRIQGLLKGNEDDKKGLLYRFLEEMLTEGRNVL